MAAGDPARAAVPAPALKVHDGSGQPMRWLRVFPGRPAQVAEVRRFVALLFASCPARDDLVLCASELATNAILHTASGDGGYFSVEAVRLAAGTARLMVTDVGAATVPVARMSAAGPESDLEAGGRGLAVVAARASRWGYWGMSAGRTVWAEIHWPAPAEAHSAG